MHAQNTELTVQPRLAARAAAGDTTHVWQAQGVLVW